MKRALILVVMVDLVLNLLIISVLLWKHMRYEKASWEPHEPARVAVFQWSDRRFALGVAIDGLEDRRVWGHNQDESGSGLVSVSPPHAMTDSGSLVVRAKSAVREDATVTLFVGEDAKLFDVTRRPVEEVIVSVGGLPRQVGASSSHEQPITTVRLSRTTDWRCTLSLSAALEGRVEERQSRDTAGRPMRFGSAPPEVGRVGLADLGQEREGAGVEGPVGDGDGPQLLLEEGPWILLPFPRRDHGDPPFPGMEPNHKLTFRTERHDDLGRFCSAELSTRLLKYFRDLDGSQNIQFGEDGTWKPVGYGFLRQWGKGAASTDLWVRQVAEMPSRCPDRRPASWHGWGGSHGDPLLMAAIDGDRIMRWCVLASPTPLPPRESGRAEPLLPDSSLAPSAIERLSKILLDQGALTFLAVGARGLIVCPPPSDTAAPPASGQFLDAGGVGVRRLQALADSDLALAAVSSRHYRVRVLGFAQDPMLWLLSATPTIEKGPK